MSAFVKKEIRLLLPGFVGCCALGLPNLFFRFNSDGSLQNAAWFFLAYVFSGALAVMLALNSFGVEIGSGNFTNLLAQPISRQKIWDTKISLLAGALLLAALFWSGCGIFRLKMAGHDLKLVDLFTGVGLFGLVVFSGGLWTVLLLRQVAAAFWFTVIVPGALAGGVAAFCGGESDNLVTGEVASVLGIYSLVGFFFARWLFFRAQDLQWSGGTIVMPEWRVLARFKAAGGSLRLWHPRAALWWKEIRLHESQFVIAFVLAALHLVVLAVRNFCNLEKSPDLKALLDGFFVIWAVMPLLVGCAAVAEERKIGTHEGQLCLPVKRRTQFIIKLLVVLGLSVLFGAIMPLLLEIGRIWPAIDSELSVQAWLSWENFETCLEMLVPMGLAGVIGFISFYVSTMTRNTLQCLGPAVLGMLLGWPLIFAAGAPWIQMYHVLWNGPLGYFILLPIVAVTLLALAYGNFQCVLVGWKLATGNVLALIAAVLLGVGATTMVYHRFWEAFMPFEPPRGAARLSLANPATYITDWAGVTVHLPDGRILRGLLEPAPAKTFQLRLGNFKMKLGDERWGTNGPGAWMNHGVVIIPPTFDRNQIRSSSRITHGISFFVGVRTNGTLCICAHQRENRRSLKYEWQPTSRQIGSATNWLAVAGWGGNAVTLRSDGTLWLWDFNTGPVGQRDPNLLEREVVNTVPVRLGTHSDWIAISENYFGMTTLAADGSLWFWPKGNAREVAASVFHEDFPTPLLDISHKPQYLGNVFTITNQFSHSTPR